MHCSFDFVGREDLPGELWEPIEIAECVICESDCTPVLGLCRVCFDRLPRVGGCRYTLAVMIGHDLGHLTCCSDCRDHLGTLVGLLETASLCQPEVTITP
jgi:hypothetical protein